MTDHASDPTWTPPLVISVGSAAQLAAIPAANLRVGQVACCQPSNVSYVYYPTLNVPADGVNYISTPGGGMWASQFAVPPGSALTLTQGGTIAAPATEFPIVWRPRDPARAPFGAILQGTLFNSTIDPQFGLGYNPNITLPAEYGAAWSIEVDFEYSPGLHKLENYWNCYAPGLGSARPIGYTLSRDGLGSVFVNLQYCNSQFVITGGTITAPNTQVTFQDGSCTYSPTNYSLAFSSSGGVNVNAGNWQIQTTGGAFHQYIAAGTGSIIAYAADTFSFRDNTSSTKATADAAVSGFRLYPNVDATGSIGLATNRWNLIRGVTVTSGDLALVDEDRGCDWLLREEPTFLLAVNRRTGERRKILTAPLDEADEAELREFDPKWAAA